MAEAPKPQRVRRRRQRKGSETKVDVKVVDIDGAVGTSPKRARRRRRRGIPFQGPLMPGQRRQYLRPRSSRLRRAIKREIKKEGLEGPRVSVQQRVSSTFGLVGPNSSGNVELELNFFLHPSLAKEANDGTSFGPVQALAAQYALWKLKFLRLIFTPMVGASAVSGTVIRASLNLSQSPGGTNWSGLGTRLHLDIHPGQKTIFHLRGDQIGGPRDGGWWLTDTNEEGSQSAGPIIEVHTLGKTSSTFQDKQWEGPLFIVEGIGMWQFANYQVKPALGMLERRQDKANVTLKADAGQPITMALSEANALTQFMLNAEPEVMAVASTSSVGETIFQVVDVGAEIAGVFAPPPFGWLIAGGWWFLKRAFGIGRTGEVQFNVYASLADAQNNRPAIAGATSSGSKNVENVDLIVTQMNAPNVGPQPTSSAAVRASVPIPMPLGTFRVHTELFPEEVVSWVSTDVYYPNAYIIGKIHQKTNPNNKYYLKTNWYIAKDGAQQQISAGEPAANSGGYIHTMYVLHNVRFATPDGGVEYIPPEPKSGAALYFGSSAESGSNLYSKYGKVVATAHVMSEQSTTSFLGIVLTLIKTTKKMIATAYAREQDVIWAQQAGNDASTTDKIKFVNIKPTSGTVRVNNVGFDEGQYLLGVSFAVGGDGVAPGGVAQIPGTSVDISVNFPFNNAGSSMFATDAFIRLDGINGAILNPRVVPYDLSGSIFSPSSADLNLNYVESNPQELDLLDKLRNLGVTFQHDLPPLDHVSDPTPEYIKEYLELLAEDGRLSTRSELALRDGNYREALKIYRWENPL